MRRMKRYIWLLLVISLCCILTDYSSAIADSDVMYNKNSIYQSYKFKESNVKNYTLKEDGETKLSDNFTVNEFRCLDDSDEKIIDIN